MTSDLLTSTLRNKDVMDILACYYIYNVCNGKQWEPIACSDFIDIMNMKPTEAAIKIRYREKARVCHMLNVASKLLADPSMKEVWLRGMLERFGIDIKYFKSHYSDVKAPANTKDNKTFGEDLDNALYNARRAKPTT